MFDPTYTDEWKRALEGEDDALIKHLAETEYPGTTLFQLEYFLMRQNKMLLQPNVEEGIKDRLLHGVGRAMFMRSQIRSFHKWIERQMFDLEALREFYQARAVIPVLGAGVSMAAGGPSWPKLVEELLLTALNPTRQKNIPIPKKGGGWYYLEAEKVRKFNKQQKTVASQALKSIQEGSTDIELLMKAAQMCADLFKEQFFSWVTPLLYMECATPSPIHSVIAELASSPDQKKPGWAAIINYCFDNLMGEAMQQQGRSYSVLTVKDGIGIQTVPVDQSVSTNIIHVHGYVPREIMRIDGSQ